jgi:hypothetical protein
MRVWDCSPRELNDKHLRAEHKEIGALLNGRWFNHPEAKRFRSPKMKDLLIKRHMMILREGHRRGMKLSIEWIKEYETPFVAVWYQQAKEDWYRWRKSNPWPKSYKYQWWSPWKRDQMTRIEYITLGNNWSRAYKYGKRPVPDPFHISVRKNPYK